ncbi:hypothetical protein EBR96_02660, partial [bacterium]|nr:hypothetical protein [bacterium]
GSVFSSGGLTLGSGATLNINSGGLFIAGSSNRVGIGTTVPVAPLHLLSTNTTVFDPSNTQTWNPLIIQNRSFSADSAAGILFTTDTKVSANTGSGIVALRSSSVAGNPGSHLVFVTDPEASVGSPATGFPLERMRIESSGNVGIGTSLPQALLHVAGKVIVRDDISAAGLETNLIQSISTVTVTSVGPVIFKSVASANSDIRLGGGLYFDPTDNPTASLARGRLYVNRSNNDLYYVRPGTTAPLNISSAYTGLSGQVPFFDSVGNLSDSAALAWDPVGNTFYIGTANYLTKFEVASTINNATLGDNALHRYSVRFADRSPLTTSSGKFTGQQDAANTVLRVDTISRPNALVVSSAGLLGINTGAPSAAVSIVASDNSQLYAALDVTDAGGNTRLRVRNDGKVGIRTSSPSAELEVVGTVSANVGRFTQLTASSLNVGNYAFYVNGQGNIGVGTSQPNGNLSFLKELTPANVGTLTDSSFVSQKMSLQIGSPQANTQFFFNKDITGVDISMESVAGSVLGDNDLLTAPVAATGVSVNMSQLSLASDATAVGLDVNVSGTSGTRYAGVFLGGNVGIGTSRPSVALHVVGDISASSLSITGNVQAGQITANRLSISQSSVFQGTVTVNTLYASVVSANNILLSGSLQVASASFTTINATALGRFAKLGVNVANPTVELEVSGNAIVSGNLTVGSATVSTINLPASGILAISGTGTVNISSTLNIGRDLYLEKGAMFMRPLSTAPTSVPGRSIMYVDSLGNLNFLKPAASVPINISSAFSGIPGQIAFFDPNGNLASMSDMAWDSAKRQLKIGTSNLVSTLLVQSHIGNASSGTINGQQIDLKFTDRLSGSSAVGNYTGLNINLSSTDPTDPVLFGRLAEGETAVGLKVDVSNLIASRFVAGGAASGYKYAAAFLGGNVGVGTSRPDAVLHVLGQSGNVPFRIDTGTTANALVVASNGRVGIGTSIPGAALSVVGVDNTAANYGLAVADSTGLKNFVVRNDGKVGIGTINPSQTLDVVGTVNATDIMAGTVSVNSLIVGGASYNFYVNDAGKIGIGTSSPGAGIAVSKVFNSASLAQITDTTYVGQRMNITLGEPQAQTQYFFNKNLTGMDVQLATGTGAFFGDTSGGPFYATGVSINMTGLALQPNGQAVGLYVNVTGNTGTRYAGLFLGGNVGIGHSSPIYALQVSGDVRADRLILSEALEADRVTANVLTIKNRAIVDGSVSVNTLVADTVSANNIVMTGTLSVSTGSFTTVNVTKLATFGKLGVGVTNPTKELEVLGDAVFSGTFNVGVLKTSTINSSGTDLLIKSEAQLLVDGGISTNRTIVVNNGGVLLIKANAVDPGVDNTYGRLYVDGSGHLNYLRPGVSAPSAIPISGSLTGTPNALAFYGPNGLLTGSTNVWWDSLKSQLVIGTGNTLSSLLLESTMNSQATGLYRGQVVSMNFGERNAVSNARFVGMDLSMTGVDPSNPNDFGRLAAGETAIGLRVDMTSLRGRYTSLDQINQDGSYNGQKIGAAFLGGSVGVGVELPAALLHVKSAAASDTVFRVDSYSKANALLVSGAGNVGIGDSAPASRLSVRGSSDVPVNLRVDTSSGATALSVLEAGTVGVGTSTPAATLHVSGDVKVSNATVSDVLNIGASKVGIGLSNPTHLLQVAAGSNPAFRVGVSGREYALVVNNAGNVGIGVSNPSANLHIDGVGVSGIGSGLPAVIQSGYQGMLALNNDASGAQKYTFFGNRKSGTDVESVMLWNTSAFKFGRDNSGTIEDVMTIKNSLVGIGKTNPVARLDVGPISNSSTDIIFKAGESIVVAPGGEVGIGGVVEPGKSLTVAGDSKFNGNVQVTDTVSANSFIVSEKMTLIKGAVGASATTLQSLTVNVGTDTAKDITGLNISLSSIPNTLLGGQRNYTVWGGAAAVGLYVDMSTLPVTDAGTGSNGYKYAGIFKGGYVGIGTTQPKVPLDISAPLVTLPSGANEADLLRLGSTNGSMTLRDFDNGRIGFVTSKTGSATSYVSLVVAPGDGTDTAGRVGIGTTAPDKALVVNGDTRLG